MGPGLAGEKVNKNTTPLERMMDCDMTGYGKPLARGRCGEVAGQGF